MSTSYGIQNPHQQVWDPVSLAWVAMVQPVIKTDTLTVSGSMTVSNFPETQSIDQDITVSSGNSLTTTSESTAPPNLAVGATFTGSSQSTLGVAGIQVSLKTDQNCIVYVDQSPDGTNWDINDHYDYYASINNLGVTVQAVNSYVRVRVTNVGFATTTYIRLQTVLCPVVEALPRSLDDDGNLRVGVNGIVDDYGFSIENTPMGEMRTITPCRLVGSVFEGTVIDPNFWIAAASAAPAAVAAANAQLTITSGTAAAANVTCYSNRRARAVGGVSNRYRATVTLEDAGTNHNKRRWGIGWGASMPTVTDGAWFQMNNTTFGIRVMKGGTETEAFAINSGSFNGMLGATWSPVASTVYSYEIYWTSIGIHFVVDDQILHSLSSTATTWANTRSFHAFQDSLNDGTGVAASVIMRVRVATIYRLGQLLTSPHYIHISGNAATYNVKYTAGILHKIIFNNTSGTSLTVYDAAAGTTGTMAIITTASAAMGSWDFECPFYNGLTIVTAGNSLDATVVFE